MEPCAASWQLHEFIPIVSLLAAASPIFLEIVKDGFSLVIMARILSIFWLNKVLPATLIDAPEFAFFGLEQFLIVFLFFLLLLLDLIHFYARAIEYLCCTR